MLIKNKHGILHLGFSNGKHLMLLPELNEVALKDWNQVKQNPVIKAFLEDGTLEILKEDPKEEVKEDSGLKEFNPKKANQLVKETVDRTLLNKWLKMETRASVLKALNEQINLVTVKPKDIEAHIG